ncbi:hypothetical protein Tco_0843054 [Tanacetum coccineum]|uniref:Uncharacterized protein n=1 Tax=Tanacetum coccineum TaxID=301880 RepID=A0ABQ5B4J5_9ASTR
MIHNDLKGYSGGGVVDLTGDEDPTNDDGDNDMGGKISSGRKKSRESNSGDGGNTRDGGKTVGGAIGAHGGRIGDLLLVALYACMTFIYGSSWKGEMASEAKRSLDKSSKDSEEVFPSEAGNSPVKPGYSQEYL